MIERPTHPPWSEIGTAIEHNHAGLFRGAFPRNYRTPEGYMNPRSLAHRLTSLRLEQDVNEAGVVASLCAQRLVRAGVPLWWIGSELGQSLLATDLPDAVRFHDVPFPYSSFCIMLPRGLLADGDGFGAPFLVLTKIPRESLAQASAECGVRFVDESWQHHGLLAYATMTERDDCFGFKYYGTWHLELTVKEWKQNDGMKTEDAPVLPGDSEFMDAALRLGLGCAWIIASRPELIEPEAFQKRAKHKPTGGKLDLYTPRWVGKYFRSQRERMDRGGTHSTPVTHWRRGHWRNQRTGAGRTGSKLVWLEPMLIGAKAQEAEAPA